MSLTPTSTATATARSTATFPAPPPVRYAGVPSASSAAGWVTPNMLWLAVPHRSQYDGTPYAITNCGPTSLGMVLEAFGLKDYPTDALRGEINRIQGIFSPDEGTSLPAIVAVAARAGLHPMGLYSRPGAYKRWTMEDLRAHLLEGRPIITLVLYAALPGAVYDPATNHYIVLSGVSGDQFIYNDSAHPPGRGGGLLISPEQLRRAWDFSVIPGQAVAFALDAQGDGLLKPAAKPSEGEAAADPAAAEEEAESTLAELSVLLGLLETASGEPGDLDPVIFPGLAIRAEPELRDPPAFEAADGLRRLGRPWPGPIVILVSAIIPCLAAATIARASRLL